ncbi:MAG: hypothetical protein Q4G35_08295 [Propionibacteriaceae bacterium]|nr:hypothetical protein [Propionibacteriaceae bacterium]
MPRRQLRVSEDLLAEMIHDLGWGRAMALVHREAELLNCHPTSSYAVRSAYAVHMATVKDRPTPTQGELPITP